MTKCHVCKNDNAEWRDDDKNPLCPDCRAAPRHRYHMLCRPPGYAQQPDGWIDREVWMPSQRIPGSERAALGWAEYTTPLDPETVWKWDMLPADANEEASYWAWRDEERR